MLLIVGLFMVHPKFRVFQAVADWHLTLWTERLLKVKGGGATALKLPVNPFTETWYVFASWGMASKVTVFASPGSKVTLCSAIIFL